MKIMKCGLQDGNLRVRKASDWTKATQQMERLLSQQPLPPLLCRGRQSESALGSQHTHFVWLPRLCSAKLPLPKYPSRPELSLFSPTQLSPSLKFPHYSCSSAIQTRQLKILPIPH